MHLVSYAVVWRENGQPHSGRLELGPSGLCLLRAGVCSGSKHLEIAYGDIVGVRVGRAREERLNGGRTVIIERRLGCPLTVGALNGVGVVDELITVLNDRRR